MPKYIALTKQCVSCIKNIIMVIICLLSPSSSLSLSLSLSPSSSLSLSLSLSPLSLSIPLRWFHPGYKQNSPGRRKRQPRLRKTWSWSCWSPLLGHRWSQLQYIIPHWNPWLEWGSLRPPSWQRHHSRRSRTRTSICSSECERPWQRNSRETKHYVQHHWTQLVHQPFWIGEWQCPCCEDKLRLWNAEQIHPERDCHWLRHTSINCVENHNNSGKWRKAKVLQHFGRLFFPSCHRSETTCCMDWKGGLHNIFVHIFDLYLCRLPI